jgi:hypothetical protein
LVDEKRGGPGNAAYSFLPPAADGQPGARFLRSQLRAVVELGADLVLSTPRAEG